MILIQRSKGHLLARNRCPSCGGHLVEFSAQPDKVQSKCQACKAEVTVTGSTHVQRAALPKATRGITIRDRSNEKRNEKRKEMPMATTETGNEKSIDKVAELKMVRQAMQDKKLLSFNYVDTKGVVTFRTIEPYKLTAKNGLITLYGFCLEKAGIRTFTFTNMCNLKLQASAFEPRWPIEDYLQPPVPPAA